MRGVQRALIADDDPMMQAIGAASVRALGFDRIDLACSGKEALDLVGSSGADTDLIITDLNMPDLDGLQFLRHLTERGFAGGVVIVSGEDDTVVKAASDLGRRSGLNILGCARKPLSPKAIADLITDSMLVRRVPPPRPVAPIDADDVRNAIKTGQIEAHFQPQFDVATRSVAGVEALARWTHAQYGPISPEQFIPIAEAEGLVSKLTEAMLDRSLALVADLGDAGSDLCIAVNTDAETVKQVSFPDRVAARCAKHGIPHSNVTFEVTERSLLDENAASIEVLARLRMAGFGVSIDDFGTGHTNIRQLCVYPFSELKIDRSFLSGAMGDPRHMTCLQAMVDLGAALGLTTVAEGIETATDVALLERLGVDWMQGYFLARPMAHDRFVEWYGSTRECHDGAQRNA